MIAQYKPPKSDNGSGSVCYRCRLRYGRAVPEELKSHPSNIYIREDAVMASVDRWLATELNDPDWIAAAAGPDAAEAARADVLRERLAAVEGKITNLVAAVEGADAAPEVLIDQLSARTHERDKLKGELVRLAARQAVATEEVEELIDYVGGLASALRAATDEEKADLYQELGLDLTYEPLAHQLRAELMPWDEIQKSVRGGTCPPGLTLRISRGDITVRQRAVVNGLCEVFDAVGEGGSDGEEADVDRTRGAGDPGRVG